MKTINFRNNIDFDVIAEAGIKMECDENMNLVISDEDYARMEQEFPAAFMDCYEVELDEPVYVAFHIGRGGHFRNPGHLTFLGFHDFEDIIRMAVNDGKLFINDTDYDPETDVETELPRERWTATDAAGNTLLEEGELDGKTGRIEFDTIYDADYATTLEDLDEREWHALAKAYMADDAAFYGISDVIKKTIEENIADYE